MFLLLNGNSGNLDYVFFVIALCVFHVQLRYTKFENALAEVACHAKGAGVQDQSTSANWLVMLLRGALSVFTHTGFPNEIQ